MSVTLRNAGVKMAANTLLGKGPFALLNALFADLIMVKEMARLLEEDTKYA